MNRRAVHFKMILRLSLRELTRSHIIWAALAMQLGLSILMAPIAEVGFDEAPRIYDTLSYFVVSLLGVAVASFLGAFLWARDSSKTGLGEVFCRQDFGRFSLLASRLAAYAVGLVVFSLAGLVFYAIGLQLYAPGRLSLPALAWMGWLTFWLNLLALSLACCLATLTRPAFAALAAIALIASGGLAESLSGVTSLTQQDLQMVSPSAALLNSVVKIWQPQSLVIEQRSGEWLLPTAEQGLMAVLWAMGWIAVLMAITFFIVRLRDPQDRV
jgi:hypothetical protein